ncbi:MAG: cupredoxin domain-containing protein [Bacillota bacterium]|nr:cupredoxin domain-containing protein [Bacillota bacterium]
MEKSIKQSMTALALVSALSFALAGCGASNTAKATSPKPAKTVKVATNGTTNTQVQTSANQYIVVEPGGKMGPDKKMHDVFLGGDIKITKGQPVTLHFLNYDDATHTYTSADLGLNVKINGTTKKGTAAETTYTFTPTKTGTFNWLCADKCDDWSMAQKGYMQGTITVLPSTNKVQYVSMVMNAGYHLGTDGKLYDTATPGDITVKAGQPVQLTVYNFDDSNHTVTNKDLNLNLNVVGSKSTGTPSISTVQFTPAKAGKYMWNCMVACDGYSMSHPGFMMGNINVVQ